MVSRRLNDVERLMQFAADLHELAYNVHKALAGDADGRAFVQANTDGLGKIFIYTHAPNWPEFDAKFRTLPAVGE